MGDYLRLLGEPSAITRVLTKGGLDGHRQRGDVEYGVMHSNKPRNVGHLWRQGIGFFSRSSGRNAALPTP